MRRPITLIRQPPRSRPRALASDHGQLLGPQAPIPAVAPRTSQSENLRDLKGANVLLDTYNMRLRYGSGIKSYGLALVQALQRLEATISLLGDQPKRRARHGDLNEVLLYDAEELMPRTRRKRAMSTLRVFRGILTGIKAEYIPLTHVIQDRRLGAIEGVHDVYNIPHCYRLAHLAYQRTKRPLRVKVQRDVNIWHATCPLPVHVPGVKKVTTIHDLIPLRLPYTTLDNKRLFYRLVRDSVLHSDLILAVSECTKRDILSFFDIPEEKIVVTYQAVAGYAEYPSESITRITLGKFDLKPGGYVLFVGNIEPKKNVGTLIESFGAADTDLPLVIVGRKAWLWKEHLAAANAIFGSEERAKEKVRLLDYVSNRELGVLYRNARCFAFPSLYEGFGLPPLEAMRHGCPVITSNAASLPEVCGDAALYVDPHDSEGLREKLEVLIGDDTTRTRLVEAGYERVRQFSAQRYTERLAKAYSKIL